jgi:hypothetical protein
MLGRKSKQKNKPQPESPQAQSLLFQVPRDVRVQNTYPHFTRDTLCLFSLTCKRAAAETMHQRILHAAVGAEPESYQQKDETSLAAIAMLKKHPEFLFRKGNVIDHFGRNIFASPYQILLGAGDCWATTPVIEEILPKIKDGKALAVAQFQEQFPNCQLPYDVSMGEELLYDERNKLQIAQVIVQLEIIAKAIKADPCTNGLATLPDTNAAVAELCKLFAPKPGEVIETGLHFPLAIMREIFKVYAQIYLSHQWNRDQLAFFSREVIGAALMASTAVDGQCFKLGFKHLNLHEIKGPDRRDGLFCRQPKGIPQGLAPLDDKLGRTMFVDPYHGQSCFQSSSPGFFDSYDKEGDVGEARSLPGMSSCIAGSQDFFGKLLSHKNIFHEVFLEDKKSRCVIF